MKKRILMAISLILATAFGAFAQDCFKYFPQKEGTKMEITSYNDKDKVTGVAVYTILKKTKTDAEERLHLRIESKSKDSDSVFTQEFDYICKDGKMYVDMKSYLGNLGAYNSMQVEINADKIEIPSNPTAGQTLQGGEVLATVTNNGIPFMKIGITLSNRKVEKFEDITVSGKSYKCFKITQDSETRMSVVKIKGSSAEWIAENAGVVRSEQYDKRGNRTSYSLLTKLE
jgi:hypothetical protein